MTTRGVLWGVLLAAGAAGCVTHVPRPAHDISTEQAVAPLPVRFKGTDITTAAERHTEIDTGQIRHFDVSPDAQRLLFDGTIHYPQPNLYLKSAYGRGLTLRTDDAQFQYITPAFSPRGDFIAYASDRYGNFDIFIAPSDEKTEPIALTNSPVDEAYPSWFERLDENGKICERKIAYCADDPMSGEWVIRIVDVIKSTTMEVTRGLRPVWSPDGQCLAFQRPRGRDDHYYSIWVIDLATHHEREIVSSNEWAAIQPSWSKDGRYIAYATVYKSLAAQKEHRADKGDDIWITDKDGRYRIQLTQGEEPESWPVWGKDNRIFFLRESDGRRNIWSVRANILDHLGE